MMMMMMMMMIMMMMMMMMMNDLYDDEKIEKEIALSFSSSSLSESSKKLVEGHQ